MVLARVREVDINRSELLRQPTGADTEDHPTARQRVDRRDELGRDQRRPVRQHHHSEPEPDPARAPGHRGMDREWVEQRDACVQQRPGAVGIRCGWLERERHVVANPHRMEPEPLGLLRQSATQLGVVFRRHGLGHRETEVPERDADIHSSATSWKAGHSRRMASKSPWR